MLLSVGGTVGVTGTGDAATAEQEPQDGNDVSMAQDTAVHKFMH